MSVYAASTLGHKTAIYFQSLKLQESIRSTIMVEWQQFLWQTVSEEYENSVLSDNKCLCYVGQQEEGRGERE